MYFKNISLFELSQLSNQCLNCFSRQLILLNAIYLKILELVQKSQSSGKHLNVSFLFVLLYRQHLSSLMWGRTNFQAQ